MKSEELLIMVNILQSYRQKLSDTFLRFTIYRPNGDYSPINSWMQSAAPFKQIISAFSPSAGLSLYLCSDT